MNVGETGAVVPETGVSNPQAQLDGVPQAQPPARRTGRTMGNSGLWQQAVSTLPPAAQAALQNVSPEDQRRFLSTIFTARNSENSLSSMSTQNSVLPTIPEVPGEADADSEPGVGTEMNLDMGSLGTYSVASTVNTSRSPTSVIPTAPVVPPADPNVFGQNLRTS